MPEKKLIGTDANQVPTNGMLGTMAFQDFSAVNITGGKIASTTLNGVLPESLIPTLTFAGKVSDTALSSNVFLKTSEQTLSYRLTLAAPTVSYSSVILPHGVAPTGALDGGMWTTTSGLFVRINGVTEQLAELGANTFTGKQSLPAATVSAASLNLAHGTAPTGAINGDVWTTTSGLFARINGNTEQLAELGANVFTGKQSFLASTVSAAPINLGEGVAPSSPINGDLWATSGGIFAQINGATSRINDQLKQVRVITASGGVTALSTDEVIVINKTANETTTLTLMASPETGKILYIKDGKGNSNSFPTTIQGNGKNIDAGTFHTINSNWGRVALVYNGTIWNILSI
jgi:hypothetical protein